MDVILKKYFWVVNLLVIGVCASFGGRAVAHFLEGAYLVGEDVRVLAPPRHSTPNVTKVHAKDSDEIIKRDIFCSGCSPPPPPVNNGKVDDHNTDVKTALPLELVSTMVVSNDEKWSMAVIRDLSTKEKDPAMYNRNAAIGNTGATVFRVLSKRVYIKNAGRLEYLELEGQAQAATTVASYTPPPSPIDTSMGDIDKGVTCTGNSCNVDRKLVESLLQNTAMLATAARFVPSIKDGKPNGFKLYAIRPNSIFGKIGLQNGDTIKSINGLDMSSPDKALELYTKLRNASHLSVAVERRGDNTTLDYTIR